MKYLFIKSISLIFLFIFFSIKLISAEADSAKSSWTPKGIVGFNISQIAFDNWVLGGDNAITYSVFGNFGADYKKNNWSFINSLKLVYGQTKLGDAEFKTNDNELYLEDVLSYNIGWQLTRFSVILFVPLLQKDIKLLQKVRIH